MMKTRLLTLRGPAPELTELAEALWLKVSLVNYMDVCHSEICFMKMFKKSSILNISIAFSRS